MLPEARPAADRSPTQSGADRRVSTREGKCATVPATRSRGDGADKRVFSAP
jgi:hypothetical protein